jgi:hypothetical protein
MPRYLKIAIGDDCTSCPYLTAEWWDSGAVHSYQCQLIRRTSKEWRGKPSSLPTTICRESYPPSRLAACIAAELTQPESENSNGN